MRLLLSNDPDQPLPSARAPPQKSNPGNVDHPGYDSDAAHVLSLALERARRDRRVNREYYVRHSPAMHLFQGSDQRLRHRLSSIHRYISSYARIDAC